MAGENFGNQDLATKYYKTMQSHLENDDITTALKAMRELIKEAKGNVNRPMVRLLAAKAMIETHTKIAELEVKAGSSGNSVVANIYNNIPKENDDLISISQRINRGLSNTVKR